MNPSMIAKQYWIDRINKHIWPVVETCTMDLYLGPVYTDGRGN